ncbi:hypothetical protein HDV05_001182 [Chytridiales sp. JEL 0842]|nr:hypothetical protein HDV05_001182 [Chytridiales sp. JEL 0842]
MSCCAVNDLGKAINATGSWRSESQLLLTTTTSKPSRSLALRSVSSTSTKLEQSANSHPINHSPPAPHPGLEADQVPAFWHTLFPAPLHPYLLLARLDRPAGTYLLFLPCTWSIAMSTYALPTVSIPYMLSMITLFGTGAFVMRGAGCTINDMWDRDLDRKVERTRMRPIASGLVSYKQAVAFLGLQLSMGLAVLVQLNWYSIFLGASSLVLVGLYPLMKRITYWPQAVLGLTFNWGILVGWSAIAGSCNWEVAVPLYIASWCWTMVYDTIYALQDKSDDLKAGVKSTALLFGDNIKVYLSGFAVVSTCLLGLSGYMNGQGILYYGISVAGAAAHYLWTIGGLDVKNRVDAAHRFRQSRWLGVIVFAGVMADLLLKRFSTTESEEIEPSPKNTIDIKPTPNNQ